MRDELYDYIGQRIQTERNALGFSQSDLAAEIGLTRTSVVNIESGRQRLPIHVLYAVADALGVSVPCLLPNNRNDIPPASTLAKDSEMRNE